MTMHELAFQNYILVLSYIAMVLLVPVTLVNLATQFSSSEDRARFLHDYDKWRKGYNYQIVIMCGLMIWFLHPAVVVMTIVNLVIWFAGDFYHFLGKENSHV